MLNGRCAVRPVEDDWELWDGWGLDGRMKGLPWVEEVPLEGFERCIECAAGVARFWSRFEVPSRADSKRSLPSFRDVCKLNGRDAAACSELVLRVELCAELETAVCPIVIGW